MMQGKNTEVLLASVASKRKSKRLRFILIASVVFPVLVVTVFLFTVSFNVMEHDDKNENMTSINQLSLASSNIQPADQGRKFNELFNAYTSRIRPALKEIPEKTFFGNRASEIIDLIENDFEDTGKNNSRYLEIRENISKAEDLISTYKDELRFSLQRVEMAFEKFDKVVFEREMSNLVELAINNPEVNEWASKKASALEYFNYAIKARRAKSELNAQVEIDALREIDRLGFGNSDSDARIKFLQDAIAEHEFAAHILATRQLISTGNFKKANKEIIKAASIFPQRSQIKELTVQINEELKKIAVADLILVAETHRRQDDWLSAQKSYSEAILITPSSKEALYGYQLSQSILSFEDELNDVIDRPLRLKSAEVMAYAKSLVVNAEPYTAFSISLEMTRDKALFVVGEMGRPRAVSIDSDGIARIKVQGVGYIEPTKGKVISLISGNYEFHAECKGRKTKIYNLTVPLSDKQPLLKVMCGDVL